MTEKIKQWSFSRWKTYDQCPRKAKYLYVDGLREPDNEWTLRGTATHLMAENYLNGAVGKLPDTLAKCRKDFQWLKREGAFAERELAVNMNWEPVAWKDPAAWCRGKVDAVLIADPFVVVDFKTGKERDSHRDQLDLYAALCFLHFPATDELTCELWYLDTGVVRAAHYWKTELKGLISSWNNKVKAMLTDKTFPYSPSPLCKYCHFRKENGGPCEF